MVLSLLIVLHTSTLRLESIGFSFSNICVLLINGKNRKFISFCAYCATIFVLIVSFFDRIRRMFRMNQFIVMSKPGNQRLKKTLIYWSSRKN